MINYKFIGSKYSQTQDLCIAHETMKHKALGQLVDIRIIQWEQAGDSNEILESIVNKLISIKGKPVIQDSEYVIFKFGSKILWRLIGYLMLELHPILIRIDLTTVRQGPTSVVATAVNADKVKFHFWDLSITLPIKDLGETPFRLRFQDICDFLDVPPESMQSKGQITLKSFYENQITNNLL